MPDQPFVGESVAKWFILRLLVNFLFKGHITASWKIEQCGNVFEIFVPKREELILFRFNRFGLKEFRKSFSSFIYKESSFQYPVVPTEIREPFLEKTHFLPTQLTTGYSSTGRNLRMCCNPSSGSKSNANLQRCGMTRSGGLYGL